MSRGFGAASARSSFALRLTVGVILLTALFLLRDPAEATRAARVAGATTSTTGSTPRSAATPGQASSMEAATLALKTRLATKGGGDEDWELLARSYGFMGRSEDAQLARQHETSPAGDLGDAVAASAHLLPGVRSASIPGMSAGPSGNDAERLLASAEQHRRKREFEQACKAYAAAVAIGAMNADAWADYADAQASLAGRLAGPPEKAIAAALAEDPQHPKALWLKASLAHEQRRYRDALETWQRLLALVPPGSSDARIVEANIAEAKRLAAG